MGRRGCPLRWSWVPLARSRMPTTLLFRFRSSTCTPPPCRRCYFSAQDGQLQPYRRLCLVPRLLLSTANQSGTSNLPQSLRDVVLRLCCLCHPAVYGTEGSACQDRAAAP